MNRMVTRALFGVAFGVLLYVVAVAWMDAERIAEALRQANWWFVAAAFGLSTVNYVLRFAKWELCLGWLGVRKDAPDLTLGRSAAIYVAGFSMSVTPGKLGEVLRSVLLRATDGIAFTRTAPVVIADRVTDLIALVALSTVAITHHAQYTPVLIATLAIIVGTVVVLGSPRLLHGLLGALGKISILRGPARKAEALADSSAALLRIRPLAVLSALSVVGWGLECVGYYLILLGFPGVEPALDTAVFLWAITTLIGAVSFLPGGLGATEGSLQILVPRLVMGITAPFALASTLLIRAATLWYAEVLGGLALWAVLRDPRVHARATDGSQSEPTGPVPSDGPSHSSDE